ncbi:MAG: hypothetical protein ABI551_06645 [Polyangiaceae bacterium]
MRALSALALIAPALLALATLAVPKVAFAQDAAPTYHPPPAGSTSATTDADGTTTSDPNAKPKPKTTEPPSEGDEPVTDVTEKPGKTYYFVGLRYRGDIVPKFMLNLFVDEGKTFYSNTVGAEVDIRRDNFSFIPALSYVEYGSGGDTLFLEKGKDSNIAGNWSNVNSSLKAIYLTADLLWSAKIHKNVDFEFGAGFGLGVLFGDLETSWVYSNPNGPLTGSTGQRFSPCVSSGGQVPTQQGCNARDHQNSSTSKIDHYDEPSWANGGSKPNLFVHLAIPQFGLRIKPTKDMEYRVGLGFSLTGFWFGLSGNYGLERALEKKSAPTPHDNPK